MASSTPPTTTASTSPKTPTSDTELTPLRAHYLKKSLVELEFKNELDAITSSSSSSAYGVAFLGPPFAPPPQGTPRLDLPFLRFAFRECVLTFPFLAAAPVSFFPDKLQPFLASVFARGISADGLGTDVLGDEDDGMDPEEREKATRQKVRHRLERNLALFFGSGLKLTEQEEVVRLTQRDLDRLEQLARRRQRKGPAETFEVNVVCVRTVVERAKLRSKAHEVREEHSYQINQTEDTLGVHYPYPSIRARRCLCLPQIRRFCHSFNRGMTMLIFKI